MECLAFLARVSWALAAATVPVVFVLSGVIVDILGNAEASRPFGHFLPNLRLWLPADLSRLGQVGLTLLIALGFVLLQVVCLFLFYRRIQVVAVGLEAAVMEKLWDHSRKLALARTLSGQQTRWSMAWSTICARLPRPPASVAGGEPPLVTSSVGHMPGPRVLDYTAPDCADNCGSGDRHPGLSNTRPISQDAFARGARARNQRRNSSHGSFLQGPLLESVHSQHNIQNNFREQLQAYRKEAVKSPGQQRLEDTAGGRPGWPVRRLFVFLVSIQILRAENNLTLAGCLTFIFACGGVALSAHACNAARAIYVVCKQRQRTWSVSYPYLRTASVVEARKPKTCYQPRRPGTCHRARLCRSQAAGKHLCDLHARQTVWNRSHPALASLRLNGVALGIGRPVSGRMLLDDVLVSDIEPTALKKLGVGIRKTDHW